MGGNTLQAVQNQTTDKEQPIKVTELPQKKCGRPFLFGGEEATLFIKDPQAEGQL